MAEAEKEGEPVTRDEAEQMAEMEIKAKPFHTHQNNLNEMTANAGKVVEKLELSYIADRSVKLHINSGKLSVIKFKQISNILSQKFYFKVFIKEK